MNIYVLMKRTFDMEEQIVIENGEIRDDGEYIINPYDEYAIEEAVQLRDEHGGEVTVVLVGDEEGEKQLRTALAMGADQAFLINNEDVVDYDQFSTSNILAAFFEDREFDLIIGGNVSIDHSTGQVGPRLAELLDIAHVSTITSIEVSDDEVKLERDSEGDVEKVEASLPLLVTAQQGLNEPRYPSLPNIMKAKKKPLEVLDLDDLDLDEEDVEGKTEIIDQTLPPKKQAGRMLEGEVQDQVSELVRLVKDKAKVI
ncbi:electron transfer flavoprotein subunit beta/FixA family protein [Aquibacillus sediminis]|uniref:electron transfer flavoprotein subunit beta/FixA family protein n=1 Tax=Aquibacillus sediminis TaxID=2574734 RepID=UPI001109890E|nr:electron transfer flavoprotein subunit beta/FixA family protein [Aquibacillus sediminis]